MLPFRHFLVICLRTHDSILKKNHKNRVKFNKKFIKNSIKDYEVHVTNLKRLKFILQNIQFYGFTKVRYNELSLRAQFNSFTEALITKYTKFQFYN